MNVQSSNSMFSAFKPVIKSTQLPKAIFNSPEGNALYCEQAKSIRNGECFAEKSLCKTERGSSKQNEFRRHSHAMHEATFRIKKSFELQKPSHSAKFEDAALCANRRHSKIMSHYGRPDTSKIPLGGMITARADRYETTSDESGNKSDSDSKSSSLSGTCGQIQTCGKLACIRKFRIERVNRSRPDKEVVCYSETQPRNEFNLSSFGPEKVFRVTRMTKGKSGYEENISKFPKKVFTIQREGINAVAQKCQANTHSYTRKYFKIEKVNNKRAKKGLYMMPFRKQNFILNSDDKSVPDSFNADLFFQMCSKVVMESLDSHSQKQPSGSYISNSTTVPNLNDQCLSLMNKVVGSSYLDPDLKFSLLSKTNLKAPTPLKR